MYMIVIGVLAIVLTLSGPLYRLVAEPSLVMTAVAAATLVPPIFAWGLRGRVLYTLDRHPERPGRGQAVYGRGMTIAQWLLGICHAGLMLTTDWLRLVHRMPVVGDWPLIPGLMALTPFLLSIILVWVVVFPADRAVRQIALEVYLFRGKPVRPVWHLGQYLLYNLRHQVLFVLIPMLLILAASDIVLLFEESIRELAGQRYAPDFAIGVAAIGVALITPEILRHVWVTQRLPAGPLRDRLLLLCERLRLRCRDILVWRSGGMVVNAAVMGVVAPLRYVLITDAMLEQMSDRQIEAVFGHEAGHVKHHHIPFFLLFALLSGCAVTLFSVYTRDIAQRDHATYQLLATGLGVLLLVKWGVVFGWISRRFERQADVFGVRALALSGLPCDQPCHFHRDGVTPTTKRRGQPLCISAAHVFSNALHEVAVLNGIQPEARSWRHSSIGSRSRLLLKFAQDPTALCRFERLIRVIQITLFVITVGVSAWAAHELGIWALVLSLPARLAG